jgi:hypothetical protein
MQEHVNAARRALEARLLERAAKDAAFRRALLADPKGTLEQALQVPVLAELRLTVLEETATSRYLVLPPAPLRQPGELADADLEAVAGGLACHEGTNCYCLADTTRPTYG